MRRFFNNLRNIVLNDLCRISQSFNCYGNLNPEESEMSLTGNALSCVFLSRIMSSYKTEISQIRKRKKVFPLEMTKIVYKNF